MYYYKVFLKNNILDERFKMLMNTFDAKEMDFVTRTTARRYVYKDIVFLKTLFLQFIVFEMCNLLLTIWKSLHVVKPAMSTWHCGKSLLFIDVEIFCEFQWLAYMARDLMVSNFAFCLCSLFVYFV